MGLDHFDLIMDVEEEFDIQLPDALYGEIRTVEDLCRVVARMLSQNLTPVCLHPRMFCRIRRGLIAMGSVRKSIRPSTPLATVAGPQSLKQFWADLQNRTELDLPVLRRPVWLVRLLVTIPIIALLCSVSLFFLRPDTNEGWILFFWMLVGLTFYPALAWNATEVWRVRLPDDCRTVGDLVRRALRANLLVDTPEISHPAPEALFERVRVIVSNFTNIPVAEIHPESSLIGDLGLG